MKTDVLMVYPETPTTYWSFHHALPFVGKRAVNPPLGLMTVAAMLPDDFRVRLIDMNVEPLRAADIEAADMVFISAMIVQKRSFAQVVRMCNALKTPVVAGGPYAISSHQDIKGVDTFVLGEAEVTLPAFLADFASGRTRAVYQDSARADITRTPPPRYDLIDTDAYDTMALQYSRGCPYSCEFCDIIEMFGRVQRTKTPDQFLRELDTVYATGFRGSLFIVDDNFVGNRRKVKDLLRSIGRWQEDHAYPFILSTEASIDLAQDPELLELMARAVFRMVFVGVETPDQETLAFTGKGQNLKRDPLWSIETIQNHGIEVTGGFIVGFDTDPQDIFDRQIEFIQKAAIPVAMVGLLMALPQTQLERRLRAEGRLRCEANGNNTHETQLNFEPRMDEDELLAGYSRVLAEVYRPSRYLERCRRLISRTPDTPNSAQALTWWRIRALLRSLRMQGFSPYGLSYMRFILGTLISRPRAFPLAVTLAIKGHHFFVITKEILATRVFGEALARTTRAIALTMSAIINDSRRGRALKHRVVRIRAQMERRYRRMSTDARERLEGVYREFSLLCGQWLAALGS